VQDLLPKRRGNYIGSQRFHLKWKHWEQKKVSLEMEALEIVTESFEVETGFAGNGIISRSIHDTITGFTGTNSCKVLIILIFPIII
jgi:hypothetical protein